MGKFYDRCTSSLELCVRYLAWLNAVLDPPKTNAKQARSDEQASITRRQKFQADGVAFELPDAGEAAYVLDLLFDVGPAKAGDMGARSLEWSDIEPWLRITGYQLSMWEMRVLLRLSVAYCETLYAARNPAMSAPGSAQESPEQQQERRDRVAKQMAESLRMLARSRPQRK